MDGLSNGGPFGVPFLVVKQAVYTSIITVEPGKRWGKPCIRGLRIAVYHVLEYLASGMTEAEIIADFPDLACEDVGTCLVFAADKVRRMVSVPPV